MNWNPDQHYQERRVAHEYDKTRFSNLPGRVFNFLEKRTIIRCFSTVPKGSAIMDAPCGTGRLAEPLLVAGYRIHGMDISEAMLSVAKQRLLPYADRFTCEVTDMKHRPAHVPSFDAALCARVLMHFPLDQQAEFLSGVVALTRSIVVINHSLDSPYQRFRRRLKRWFGDHHDPARNPISNREIAALLQASGLREVKRYRLLSLISEAVYIIAERVDPVPATLPGS